MYKNKYNTPPTNIKRHHFSWNRILSQKKNTLLLHMTVDISARN